MKQNKEKKMKQKPVKSSADRLSELEERVEAITQSMNGFLDALKTTLVKVANVEVVAEQSSKKTSDELVALTSVLSESMSDLRDKMKERMVENKVNELVRSLEDLKERGILTNSTTGEITEKSFLVIQEMDKNGGLISARTQIVLSSLDEGIKSQLIGKKTGDVIDLGESLSTVVIQEVYELAAS